MPLRWMLVSLVFVTYVTYAAAQDTVGSPLSAWTPGTLDIHQIATGRGNAALIILPDGVSVLVDAGAAGDGVAETEPHLAGAPNPGAAIGRYIKRHLSAPKIDYALITHFHPDHMGGLADVYKEIPFATLLDRGWPDYSYPAPQPEALAAYRDFQKSAKVVMERFKPGLAGQIAPKSTKVEIRNIIVNGEMWRGTHDDTLALFPLISRLTKADYPTENMCSAGFRLQYGPFRYYTGGDLPGTPDPGYPSWNAPEASLGQVVGPVDVQVVSQHGSMGEAPDAFLAATQSRVFVIPSWAPSHPAPDTLKRIMNSRYPPQKKFVFATDLRPSAKTVIGQRATQLSGPPGHIVVRVEPGGAHYTVYVLNNSDTRDLIRAVAGPFPADQGR
jgi:beta-lactamase superfamily II metal-dependent hydrolase